MKQAFSFPNWGPAGVGVAFGWQATSSRATTIVSTMGVQIRLDMALSSFGKMGGSISRELEKRTADGDRIEPGVTSFRKTDVLLL
jgi:hypothetical protein